MILEIVVILGSCWSNYFWNVMSYYDQLQKNITFKVETHWLPDDQLPSNHTDDIFQFLKQYQDPGLKFPYLFHCDSMLNTSLVQPIGIAWGQLGIHSDRDWE